MALTKPDRDIIDIAAGIKAGSELTIAGGAVTLAENAHAIDTEADAASDDLDTINAGVVPNGAMVMLYAANAARTVVLKHGTGNIQMQDGQDFVLDDAAKSILLRRDGADFRDIVPRTAAAGIVFIENRVLSAATVVDFTTLDWNTYASFKITFVLTVSASMDIWMRFSQSGTVLSTGTPYGYRVDGENATFSNGANQMIVARNVYKGAANHNEGASGTIEIFPPVGIATAYRGAAFTSQVSHNEITSGDNSQSLCAGQLQLNLTAIDGIRLLPSTGNFPDGLVELWGLRKAV